MSSAVWQRLEEQFARFPVTRASSVPGNEEISEAERALGCTFAPAYREFLKRYGAAMVGADPVIGLGQAEVMGDDYASVVETTLRYRADQWKGVENWYVVSIDGAGNPVGIDKAGRVWVSDHNAGVVEPIADSFEEWLLSLV